MSSVVSKSWPNFLCSRIFSATWLQATTRRAGKHSQNRQRQEGRGPETQKDREQDRERERERERESERERERECVSSSGHQRIIQATPSDLRAKSSTDQAADTDAPARTGGALPRSTTFFSLTTAFRLASCMGKTAKGMVELTMNASHNMYYINYIHMCIYLYPGQITDIRLNPALRARTRATAARLLR